MTDRKRDRQREREREREIHYEGGREDDASKVKKMMQIR